MFVVLTTAAAAVGGNYTYTAAGGPKSPASDRIGDFRLSLIQNGGTVNGSTTNTVRTVLTDGSGTSSSTHTEVSVSMTARSTRFASFATNTPTSTSVTANLLSSTTRTTSIRQPYYVTTDTGIRASSSSVSALTTALTTVSTTRSSKTLRGLTAPAGATTVASYVQLEDGEQAWSFTDSGPLLGSYAEFEDVADALPYSSRTFTPAGLVPMNVVMPTFYQSIVTVSSNVTSSFAVPAVVTITTTLTDFNYATSASSSSTGTSLLVAPDRMGNSTMTFSQFIYPVTSTTQRLTIQTSTSASTFTTQVGTYTFTYIAGGTDTTTNTTTQTGGATTATATTTRGTHVGGTTHTSANTTPGTYGSAEVRTEIVIVGYASTAESTILALDSLRVPTGTTTISTWVPYRTLDTSRIDDTRLTYRGYIEYFNVGTLYSSSDGQSYVSAVPSDPNQWVLAFHDYSDVGQPAAAIWRVAHDPAVRMTSGLSSQSLKNVSISFGTSSVPYPFWSQVRPQIWTPVTFRVGKTLTSYTYVPTTASFEDESDGTGTMSVTSQFPATYAYSWSSDNLTVAYTTQSLFVDEFGDVTGSGPTSAGAVFGVIRAASEDTRTSIGVDAFTFERATASNHAFIVGGPPEYSSAQDSIVLPPGLYRLTFQDSTSSTTSTTLISDGQPEALDSTATSVQVAVERLECVTPAVATRVYFSDSPLYDSHGLLFTPNFFVTNRSPLPAE